MLKPNDAVLIVGAGSHAQRVAEAICASGGAILGFATTDGPSIDGSGETKTEGTLRLDQALQQFPEAAIVVGIGGIEARARIIESMQGLGRRLPPIVHPLATISPVARLADGVVVLPGAVIEWQATVALGAIIDVHAVICHEAQIGAMSHIQAGAIIGPRAIVPARSKTRIGERILESATADR